MDMSNQVIDGWIIDQVQKSLLAWYSQNGRSFPWRETRNPFYILIAEKLLQQTQAREGVVAAYRSIISLYPEPKDLANANVEDIRKIIQDLGLLYRAEEIVSMSYEINNKFQGIVPDDLSNLLSLTGVGDYAARAVLSFVDNADIEIVDTNVARFLYRFLALDGNFPSNPARNRKLRQIAREFVPAGNSRQYNFALLDFCALVCSSRKPNCLKCPILQYCKSPILESIL